VTVDSAARLKNGDGYSNYLGVYLAAMGVHPGTSPRLELPVFEKTESRAIIQPFSNFAQNAPLEYIQAIVDTFMGYTGSPLYAVGKHDTPKTLRGVDYSLLSDSVTDVMKIVASSVFVLTCRSLTANLAAGYGRPAFVWCPNDGENWNLDYPDWPFEKCLFDDGLNSAILKLASILNRTWDWSK
jgi:hypothetical protein